MALIDQARQIDVATASINRFVRSLSSSNFAAKMELARSGFRNVRAWAARHERLELESKIARARDVVKKSDELFHADRVMALHPGKFQSSDQVKAYEMAMLKIRSPGLYNRRILEESVGVGGARDVLSGQARDEYDRSLLGETDPVAALRKNLAERFGGATFGGYARADRLLNIRRQEIARKDRLTDYQREREELTERYLGDQGLADDEMNRRADRRHRLAASRASVRRKAERIDLPNRYPAFKRFFLDSRNSTKDIHAMAGYLKGMSKIPLAGGFLRADPMAIGASLAIGNMAFAANAVNDILGTSLTASLDITKIANKEAVGGKINKNFGHAATAAGLSIKSGAVHDLWINLRKKYGPATEDVLLEYGSALATADESIRPMLMDKLGIDDTVANIAMKMSGSNIGAKEARKTASAKAMSEMLLTAMKSDESGFAGKYFAYIFDTDFGRYVMSRMLSAAGADDEYERNTPPPSVLMPSAAGGTSVSVHGNIIIENADNAQDVAEGIKNYVDKHTSRLRAATSQDPGAQ